MLPRWHILLSFLLTFLFFVIFPNTNMIFLALLFLSSFLIDFDHYLVFVLKKKKFSLLKAFDYHEEAGKIEIKEYSSGIRRKGDFHLFHTLEFNIIIFALGFLWEGFFYVFGGIIFHSISDIIYLIYQRRFYRREFFLTNWIKKFKE